MELISREDAIKTFVKVIEQIEKTEEIQVIDRPCGWESIEDYVREVIGELPSQWIEINDVMFGKVYQNSFITFLSTDTFEEVKRRLSRPKGKWIDKGGNYCCSNCDSRAGYYVGNPFGEYKIYQHLSDYCSDCGAEMKEDGEE